MTAEMNPFEDVMKTLELMKIPGVDMASIVEGRRKDVDALVEANKSAFEAMQGISRKQTEMMTQAIQGVQAAVGPTQSSGLDPAKQTEMVRAAFETALADMKELSEMVRKAQADAVALMTKRATDHAAAIQKMIQPK